MDNTHLAPLEGPTDDEPLTFTGLGAGTYALEIGGSFGDERERVFFSAPFRLEGQPIELLPSEQVSTVTRRDGAVYIDTEAAVEDSRLSIVSTRLEGDTSARMRVIPEKAIRHSPIRNSLPYVEPGVDWNELRTGDPAQKVIERRTGDGRPSYCTVEIAFDDGSFRMDRMTVDPADFSA